MKKIVLLFVVLLSGLLLAASLSGCGSFVSLEPMSVSIGTRATMHGVSSRRSARSAIRARLKMSGFHLIRMPMLKRSVRVRVRYPAIALKV